MTFELPALPDIGYRIWRLRRLIAFATFIPLFTYTVIGLNGLSGVDISAPGLVLPATLLFAIVGGHAVLFPNAHEETLTVSLLLAVFAVFAPTFGGSILGWLVFLVFTIWWLLSGPGKILMWQANTSHHDPTMTSQIKVPVELEKARRWFPLHPEQARGNYSCGPRDADGAFPVWYSPPMFDIFQGLDIPEPDEFECGEDFPDEIGAPSESDPSFWAIIEADMSDFQKTRIFSLDDDGAQENMSVVEHNFEEIKGGCIVTERDTPDSYPWGLSFTMWLTDFQTDGLVHLRDLILEDDTRALKEAHRWSMLTLIGRWFAARQFQSVKET